LRDRDIPDPEVDRGMPNNAVGSWIGKTGGTSRFVRTGVKDLGEGGAGAARKRLSRDNVARAWRVTASNITE
jgi:hypothetical protein